MPNPVFPSTSITHGKVSPTLNYIYDGGDQEWRPLVPGDLIGASGNTFHFTPPTISGYRNVNLSGDPQTVSLDATKLAGFFVDNSLNDEPLYFQLYSYPYNPQTPTLTYPIYAFSTLDQNFPYSMDGFQGIVAKISTDKDGCYAWMGNNGVGVLANIYYRT